MFSLNAPWNHQTFLRFSYDFREYWKKILEKNGLMLPRRVSQEVCSKLNAGFWRLFSPDTHIYSFGLLSLLMYGTYVMFFANQPLHHNLTHNACNTFLQKSYQILNHEKLSENNRKNIVFCFSDNVYKENARNFLQVICIRSGIFQLCS